MYLDSVLCVGLMERLFLSTNRSQFKKVVTGQDGDKDLLIAVKTCFAFSLDHTGRPQYSVQKFGCEILDSFVYLSFDITNTPYLCISIAVAVMDPTWIKVFFKTFPTEYLTQQYYCMCIIQNCFEIKSKTTSVS